MGSTRPMVWDMVLRYVGVLLSIHCFYEELRCGKQDRCLHRVAYLKQANVHTIMLVVRGQDR